MVRTAISIAFTTCLLFSAAAQAEDYVITLKDNQFSPANLTIPAGQKIRLSVKNSDAVAAEFESSDLNREKVVIPGGDITLYIGPLDVGTYHYFNDFHPQTTGTITAR